MALVSCNGLFDSVYDELPQPAKGDICIDASSWTQWHYLDLHALHEATEKGLGKDGMVQSFNIPLAETAAFDADGTGIYT